MYTLLLLTDLNKIEIKILMTFKKLKTYFRSFRKQQTQE